MNQEVRFDVTPTANPDEVVESQRFIVNTDHGIGMDFLKEIVTQHVPTLAEDFGKTTKKIIRTDRYECCCCDTQVRALVEVECQITLSLQAARFISDRACSERDNAEGLYVVNIGRRLESGVENTSFTVEKLSGSEIYKGSCNPLPRKDYQPR